MKSGRPDNSKRDKLIFELHERHYTTKEINHILIARGYAAVSYKTAYYAVKRHKAKLEATRVDEKDDAG